MSDAVRKVGPAASSEAATEIGRIHAPAIDLGGDAPADSCVMVIFGAAGDLTHRELVPALYELGSKGLLPDPFAVVGYSLGDYDDDSFREAMRASVCEQCSLDEEAWRRLADGLHFVAGDFESDEGYERLSKRLEDIRSQQGIPDNVFFHLAAPPPFFGPIVDHLDSSGLARSEKGWRCLVIEKPFGEDRASARRLDAGIRSVFAEDQIYRIDHFLGKETVQNMLVFRFANPAFEPIWNRNYVDHVQITVAEDIGIGTRAGFYEETGVERDMVQNHLLQLLCMTAIEPPVSFDAASLRDETVKVLQAARVTPFDPERDAVRGQYGPGRVDGAEVVGYREEKDVDPASTTPTFAALKLTLDNWRWSGVPFYLRTGKRLTRKLTEVSIQFRPTPHLMFAADTRCGVQCNVLTFRLQPEEGILQQFVAKEPGPNIRLQPVTMNFGYASAFGVEEPPRAYAWLILDVMQGDQRLFARADWIYEAWSLVDPLVEHWASSNPPALPNYEAGTWGPPASDELLAREGRSWRAL